MLTCALLGVSLAWLYKWLLGAATRGPHTPQVERRHEARRRGREGVPGRPRPAWLAPLGVGSARRGLHGQREDRRRLDAPPRAVGKADQASKRAHPSGPYGAEVPDLLKRDFTVHAPNQRWVGGHDRDPDRRSRCPLVVFQGTGRRPKSLAVALEIAPAEASKALSGVQAAGTSTRQRPAAVRRAAVLRRKILDRIVRLPWEFAT